jgi:acetolactate decarboxylase
MTARHLLVAAFFVAIACGCAQVPGDRDTMFQVSTINALLEGVYDGDITLGELKRHGDFGVGAADELDGELVELGGEIYQLKVDGLAYPAEDSMKTPFAVVTFFEPDSTILSDRSMDYGQLKEYLDGLLPTENIPPF